MVVYLALQAALLWTCLHMLGNQFTGAAVLTAFAVDRLLTAVPLTPGGSGVVEAGTAAALIALGGAPAAGGGRGAALPLVHLPGRDPGRRARGRSAGSPPSAGRPRGGTAPAGGVG